MDIDRAIPQATIERFNAHAAPGDDGRPYPRRDPGPLFHTMKPFPRDIGTFLGFKVDRYARVFDCHGTPVAALCASGPDIGGVTIGPALTFGYIAARHAAAAR